MRELPRVRLTLVYAVLFGTAGLLLSCGSYWLVRGHVMRTVPPERLQGALASLAADYALVLGGTLLLSVVLGWLAAGRVAAPLLDRLEAGLEDQRRFVANASHELRTPLTVIRTEADLALADPHMSADELRAAAARVRDASGRVETLLDALILLARAREAPARREPADLAGAARAAAGRLCGEAARRGVTLELRLAPAPARGDRRLVERLVACLVENALRHNQPGGWARVWTGLDARGRPVARVVNTGPQLEPAAVARLGAPFASARRDCAGPGLGLALARAVADTHGAELALRARAEGGLVAEVVFPCSHARRPRTVRRVAGRDLTKGKN